ncbi:MAG: hypothetical protein AUH85_06180 [Chloroflexi bacterium 13_1_40CM_4_68_4]|nr:MAG: hypothetical protein AUH85_06180 [Chloroflexi bacterium 13_1_40CM_4_68_4]
MGDFGFTPEAMTALMFSFSAGVAALVVLFMSGYPHDCGNRYCPHRKQRNEEEDDRRFWRQ